MKCKVCECNLILHYEETLDYYYCKRCKLMFDMKGEKLCLPYYYIY